MKVKTLKELQFGSLYVPANCIGETQDPKDDTIFALIGYDYYVSFNGQEPFGVFKEEVEVIEEDDNNAKSS